MVWWKEENDLFLVSSRGPLLGDTLLGWHLCPKWVVNGWDHLMHVKEVSGKRDPKPYPFKQGEKAHGRTKRIGTYHGMGSGRKKMY